MPLSSSIDIERSKPSTPPHLTAASLAHPLFNQQSKTSQRPVSHWLREQMSNASFYANQGADYMDMWQRLTATPVIERVKVTPKKDTHRGAFATPVAKPRVRVKMLSEGVAEGKGACADVKSDAKKVVTPQVLQGREESRAETTIAKDTEQYQREEDPVALKEKENKQGHRLQEMDELEQKQRMWMKTPNRVGVTLTAIPSQVSQKDENAAEQNERYCDRRLRQLTREAKRLSPCKPRLWNPLRLPIPQERRRSPKARSGARAAPSRGVSSWRRSRRRTLDRTG